MTLIILTSLVKIIVLIIAQNRNYFNGLNDFNSFNCLIHFDNFDHLNCFNDLNPFGDFHNLNYFIYFKHVNNSRYQRLKVSIQFLFHSWKLWHRISLTYILYVCCNLEKVVCFNSVSFYYM